MRFPTCPHEALLLQEVSLLILLLKNLQYLDSVSGFVMGNCSLTTMRCLHYYLMVLCCRILSKPRDS